MTEKTLGISWQVNCDFAPVAATNPQVLTWVGLQQTLKSYARSSRRRREVTRQPDHLSQNSYMTSEFRSSRRRRKWCVKKTENHLLVVTFWGKSPICRRQRKTPTKICLPHLPPTKLELTRDSMPGIQSDPNKKSPSNGVGFFMVMNVPWNPNP